MSSAGGTRLPQESLLRESLLLVVLLTAAVLGLAALPEPLQGCGIVLTLAGMLVVIRSRSERPRSAASR
jgi:hypothetical protein